MNDLYLRAARGEAVERPPVWMMRQAGRYLPEYREVRARTDFLTLCKTPELAAEVTLQPIDRLGVDAAILFADILLPLEAMGAELAFVKGDGPQLSPVRDRDDARRLSSPDVGVSLGYVFDAVREIRRRLDSRDGATRVPLIGFAGTPWTLAAYLVEGGSSKSYGHLLGWSYRDPEGLEALLDHLAEVTVDYLLGQVEAGAQAVQLFDTWGGLLDAERWRRFAEPTVSRILEAVGRAHPELPRAYYLRGAAHLLENMARLPCEILSVDWRLPLDEVRRRVGPTKVLQGNLDPTVLLSSPEEIHRHAAAVLAAGGGQRHILNLGHGILPPTPVPHAQAFIDAAKKGVPEPAAAATV